MLRVALQSQQAALVTCLAGQNNNRPGSCTACKQTQRSAYLRTTSLFGPALSLPASQLVFLHL